MVRSHRETTHGTYRGGGVTQWKNGGETQQELELLQAVGFSDAAASIIIVTRLNSDTLIRGLEANLGHIKEGLDGGYHNPVGIINEMTESHREGTDICPISYCLISEQLKKIETCIESTKHPQFSH